MDAGKLIEDEDRARGSLTLDVYIHYLKLVGVPLLGMLVLMALAQTSLNMGSTFWLSTWSEASLKVRLKIIFWNHLSPSSLL